MVAAMCRISCRSLVQTLGDSLVGVVQHRPLTQRLWRWWASSRCHDRAAHPLHIGLEHRVGIRYPDWVVFSCFAAISLGTMSGGWKRVCDDDMGTKITRGHSAKSGCRDCRRDNLVSHWYLENSREHHAHHCRFHHGRGSYQTSVGGTLGRNQGFDDRMDADHPVSGLLGAGIYLNVAVRIVFCSRYKKGGDFYHFPLCCHFPKIISHWILLSLHRNFFVRILSCRAV